MLKLRSRFLDDIVWAGLTQVVVVFINVLLLRVLADWLDPAEMGAYMIVRRVLTIIVPLALLNLNVSLVRYVALYPEKAREYLGWGVLLSGLANFIFLGIAWFGDSKLANLVFGEPDLAQLLIPAALISAGNVTYSILYAHLRGQQRISEANIAQIAYNGILLILAFILWQFAPGTISMLVFYVYLGGGVSLVLFSIWVVWEKFRLNFERQLLNELIQYGLPRLPSSFLLAATFSIPVFAASQRVSLEAAASLGIGLAILRLFEPMAMSIGIVLMPKITDLIRQGEQQKVYRVSKDVIVTAGSLGILISFIGPGLAAEIVKIWFGNKYLTAIPVAWIGLMASGPYVAYMLLRNLLDAVTLRPVVTYLTLASTICAGFVSLFAKSEILLAIALWIGLCCLGLGAVVVSIRLLKVKFSQTDWLGLSLVFLVGLLILGSDSWLASWPLWSALILKLLVRALLVGGLVLVFWHLKVSWIMEMIHRLPVSNKFLRTNV